MVPNYDYVKGCVAMPQQKKTAAAPKIDAADLPDLTEKQQEFVKHLLAGRTGAEAYRRAYDCREMSQNTVIAEASRLRSSPNIAAWLSAARQAHLGTTVVTRESHIAELERLREIALETGNIGAAVQAEQLRGKVAGHQIERVQEVPADPIETLKELAVHQPDLAAQLAQAHGIPWQPADEQATKH